METYSIDNPIATQSRESIKQWLDSESHAPYLECGSVAVPSQDWILQNERRIALIKRRVRHSLTPEEHEELERLQADMSRQLNSAHPLPFDALMKLEEYVDEAARNILTALVCTQAMAQLEEATLPILTNPAHQYSHRPQQS